MGFIYHDLLSKQKIVDTMTLDLINQFPNIFLVYNSRNQRNIFEKMNSRNR